MQKPVNSTLDLWGGGCAYERGQKGFHTKGVRGPPAELRCRGSRRGSHRRIGFKWGHIGPHETAQQVTHRNACVSRPCLCPACALPQGDAREEHPVHPKTAGGRCRGVEPDVSDQDGALETGLRLI